MVEFLIWFVIAVFFILVSAALMFTIFGRSIVVEQRMDHYVGAPAKVNQTSNEDGTERQSPVMEQAKKYWEKGVDYTSERVTNKEKKKLDLLLRDAGLLTKMSAIEFRLIQLVGSIAGAVGAILLFSPAMEEGILVVLMSVTVALLGFRLPIFYIKKKRDQRIKQIDLDMADFFDTINLLIEAGVGVDAAINNVCHKKRGPLSDEFLQALDDMKRGKSKREAFHDLKRRVPSDALQSVMSSMIQADQLGIGMSRVLKNLTVRIREQRREKARAQAMKAPVKMLFPMVFFIFPALFIVILGPFVVDLIVNGLF
ncbi:type II secretion system F family protein [Salipaludibacillus daqingensis]|uniref:type II secretion system F family protein n=1 Tax=Salipaludibacillus daqingensis TaxID=3041001 RepID=UPI00247559E9|nr:type II secretion system F family protein [Salipaludibacillus daqingensis]